MGSRLVVRAAASAAVGALILAAVTGCHQCGLAEHDRVTVSGSPSPAPCCGGGVFKDIVLAGRTSDAEFSLSNTNMPTEAGGVDAYLVPTSCGSLFDGPYPGAAPLCSIYAGPAR